MKREAGRKFSSALSSCRELIKRAGIKRRNIRDAH
jgi:hypothetical protein